MPAHRAHRAEIEGGALYRYTPGTRFSLQDERVGWTRVGPGGQEEFVGNVQLVLDAKALGDVDLLRDGQPYMQARKGLWRWVRAPHAGLSQRHDVRLLPVSASVFEVIPIRSDA